MMLIARLTPAPNPALKGGSFSQSHPSLEGGAGVGACHTSNYQL
jgi:hypothetical protein